MKLCRLLIIIISCLSVVVAFAADSAAAPQIPPTAVTVAIAKQIDWQPSLAETGTLVAEHGIVVKAEVDGRVTKMFFQSGQMVKQGDPLIQLNPDVLNAQLKQFQAQLTLTHMAFDRSQGLYGKNVISKSDYDQAVSNYQSAQAQVEQIKAQLDQLLIEAPFSGKVGLQQVNIGDFVSPGDPLVNLQSIDPIYVDFSVPESYVSQVHTEQQVSIKSPAYPRETFKGKVIAMESLIDPNTRTLKVRAILSNKDAKLIAGAFVEVAVLLGQIQPVIQIPQIALTNAPDGKDAVYRVDNNQAVLTEVKVLKQSGTDVLIASGLKAGDQVVIAGQIKLQDKAPVQIAK